MGDRVPGIGIGIGIDGTEGCMNRLHKSLCLEKLIARHNDPDDEFHMDEHQVVSVGHQFKHGVTFMTLTTPHFLNNMARADNCCFQTQGHFDGAPPKVWEEDMAFFHTSGPGESFHDAITGFEIMA
jgi:hypothetical protein